MQWPSKKQWLAWHTFIGVLSGMMLFIICWSGTFATVSHELDWLTNPAWRSDASSISHQQLVDAYRQVQNVMPEVEIRQIETANSAGYAISVMIKPPHKAPEYVLVDPQTMSINGSYSALTIARFFRDFHMVLFNPLGIGKYLVCVFALLLLTSIVTGLLFYKRWWQKFWALPTGNSARAKWSSWHRWLGVWSLWFSLLIGVTGSWYLFEQSRFNFFDGLFSYTDSVQGAERPLPQLTANNTSISPAQLADAISMAEQAIPELTIHQISLNRGGYLFIAGQTSALLVRHRANKVYIDPTTMQLSYHQTADELSPYWRWSNMADPLHFGSFGGLYSKLIWFVFGLALSVMAFSGTWMYVKRLAAKASSSRVISLRFAVYLSWLCLAAALVIAGMHIMALGKGPDGWHWPPMALGSALFLLGWSGITIIGCVVGGRVLLSSSQ
ncbi:PepSY-associated TM helix domain-containing protein [Shewanella dokdonensis]|uniref:PepSY domain-containing protein n=1 Tax=Shewanella dokdonensis TaxID=712036 RepID=A0ABX8DIH8_9GAMM|nr:PepSY-associated TM helix domain-containing protein [Shewanella dokdonensis]MCL1075533.1 PepSY domain-containing protein [Shewanella dokdonensis]QVK24557.1 PepSY domain-containing protein [Shewanella dokdonensis]